MDAKNIKDWLVKKLSVELGIKERIVMDIINHQFDNARGSLATCNSIEFSGFGKFMFNKKRVEWKMKKLTGIQELLTSTLKRDDLTTRRRASHQLKLQNVKMDIKILKEKIATYENTN